MANDGQDLEWVQDFRAIIHSRNGLYRHRFQKQIVLTHRDCTISLECTDSDEIKASMTFHTPCDTHSVNEVEDVADGFLTNLRLSLLLRGYLIKIIGEKNLHCTNAEKGRRFRVTSTCPMAYRIEGKTKEIPHDSSKFIQSCFDEMFSNVPLKTIAERIEDHSKFSPEIADFIYNWIDFNKIYNPGAKKGKEPDKIIKFVADLQQSTIYLLHNRNMQCINKYQVPLKTSQCTGLQSYKQKEVCSSLLYIYQIRNDIFHEGKFQISDLKMINNFIFDATNSKTLDKFGAMNLSSFYDIC